MTFSDHQFLSDAFETWREQVPGQPAIAFRDNHDRERTVTYGELTQEVERRAGRLVSEGVKPADIIGIMADGTPEMAINALSVLKAGGVYLPVDPGNSKTRMLSKLSASDAGILLSGPGEIRKFTPEPFAAPQLSRSNTIITPPREQIRDLDTLQMPDRSLVNTEKYLQHIGEAMVKFCISMTATRGCPYKCAYCSKIWPKRFVTRSAEHIFEEVMVYYRMGIRRFGFYDDIFNLDVANSRRFFEKVIKNNLKVQFFFPVGFRGDILTKDYIDLAVEAGTVSISLSLETASPRLQKLIRKNLILDRFRENLKYICEKYPHVITSLQIMHGFPSETEEEARMSLDFLKSIKWVGLPYIHVLKILSNTDMEQLALENGISREAIESSWNLAYHDLPATLPFDKEITLAVKSEFINDYFMLKERLLHVLPYQMKILTRDEMVQKYNSYLPTEINNFQELLKFLGVTEEELGVSEGRKEDDFAVPDLDKKIKEHFPQHVSDKDAFRILLLDLSQFFSGHRTMLYDLVEPPLGLTYLMTHLNRKLGSKVKGKIAKSRFDFNSFADLKNLIDEFNPQLIGIRSMTFYKDFFHKTVARIRHWGVTAPIITGGPYSTSNYGEILQDKHIDLAVIGEGENTFYQLVQACLENGKALPGEEVLKEIPGLAFIPGSQYQRKTNRLEAETLNRQIENMLGKIARFELLDLSEMNRISEKEKKKLFDFNIQDEGDNYDF